jgi:hypothetical protein
MKCRYSCARPEAKPSCGMGSIARNVEFDYVVCLQHIAMFCIAQKLINIYELEAMAKNWKHTDAPDTQSSGIALRAANEKAAEHRTPEMSRR